MIFHEFFADPSVLFDQQQGCSINFHRLACLEVLVVSLADAADQLAAVDHEVGLAGMNPFAIDLSVMLQIRIENGQGYFQFCVLEVIRQELDRLIGYLGEFIGVGQLIEGRVDPIEQVADGNALSAAAVGQRVLGAESRLREELAFCALEIEPGFLIIEIALMNGEVAVEADPDIAVKDRGWRCSGQVGWRRQWLSLQ